MKCGLCGVGEAVVFVQQTEGGARTEIRLCAACAGERGLDRQGVIPEALAKLLAAVPEAERPEGRREAKVCPFCGTTEEDIRASNAAGCPTCWELFPRELLRRVYADFRDRRHRGRGHAAKRTRSAASGFGGAETDRRRVREFLLSPPPERSGGPDRDVFLKTSAAYVRNLDGLPFPRRASRSEATEARGRALEALLDRLGGDRALVLRIEDSGADEAGALVERALAGAEESRDEDGRRARALVLDLSGGSCFVNGTDHLRLVSVRSGLSPDAAFAALRRDEEALDERLGFAFSAALGFLASRPEDCGSGLSLGARAFLPGIAAAGAFDRAARELAAAGIEPRMDGTGPEGEPGERPCPWVTLRARAPLGADEEAFAAGFAASLRSLAEGERRIRERLLSRERRGLEDAAYRAAGLLASCRLLSSAEALRLLADLRTGAVCGAGPAAEGGTDVLAALDAAATLALPAHVRLSAAEKSAPDEEAARSALVRGLLPRYLI